MFELNYRPILRTNISKKKKTKGEKFLVKKKKYIVEWLIAFTKYINTNCKQEGCNKSFIYPGITSTSSVDALPH